MRSVRTLVWLIGAHLLVALSVRLVEALGGVRCGCDEGCWCKRPLLSTFRWVFRYGHRSVDPGDKEALAHQAR